jgi:hypothetical protein
VDKRAEDCLHSPAGATALGIDPPAEEVAFRHSVRSCDREDGDKPHMATEYVDDIYKRHKEIEVCTLP